VHLLLTFKHQQAFNANLKEESKMIRKYSPLLIILAILSMLASFGCGNSASDPASPNLLADERLTESEENSSAVLAIFDVTFDPETMEFEAVEVREASSHYDVTPYIAPHCVFTLLAYDPVAQFLSFNMAMTNPSAIVIWDVRTLFFSPTGSDYWLMNPDDYTKLFSPYAPDVVNPFRTYAKTAPNREFLPGLTHAEQFDVHTPATVTLPLGFKLLVSCSWPLNCEDVYEISNQTLSNPISTTVPGYISLDAYDWQNNVGQAYIDTTPITGGLTWLTNTSGTTWEGGLHNSMGAAPGKYRCLITTDSFSTPWNTYDYIDIEVIPGTIPTYDWNGTDYTLTHPGGCSMDLGVIADPGGPRDSEILMVSDNAAACDLIIKYEPYYTSYSDYVGLKNYDPDSDTFEPYPVERIDAADDGAFSFTNSNPGLFDTGSSVMVYNNQIWCVFDNAPKMYLGPAPNESRYYFDFSGSDVLMAPEDVCDDFGLGQYALFTTHETWSPTDLIFLGTMAPKYTHNYLKYKGNLDAYAGIGDGKVDIDFIHGIDVIEYTEEIDTAWLYVLEGAVGSLQVEVFQIMDTNTGWADDAVNHYMTIDVSYLPSSTDDYIFGHDLEILPLNSDYELNPGEPTVCVLISYYDSPYMNGEILLYEAISGSFIETVGDATKPALENYTVHYLDTDDGDWEIHVSNYDPAGNRNVTVFDHS